MDVTEKQGAIARDDGSCALVTDLEAHRTDWKRAIRIILIVQMPDYGCYNVLGDDAEGPSFFHIDTKLATLTLASPFASSQSQPLRVSLPRQICTLPPHRSLQPTHHYVFSALSHDARPRTSHLNSPHRLPHHTHKTANRHLHQHHPPSRNSSWPTTPRFPACTKGALG